MRSMHLVFVGSIAICGGSCGGGNTAAPVDPDVEAGSSLDVGNEDASSIDAGIDDDGSTDAFTPAHHPPAPQVRNPGGPVLAAPHVVPVFFVTPEDDPLRSKLEDFLAQLSTSSYWTTVASEYGVGAMSVAPSVLSSDPPPTTQAALESFLKGLTDGSHASTVPPLDASSLFAVFLPGRDFSSPTLGAACGYGGYHLVFEASSGATVPYALIPRCPSLQGLTGIDAMTLAASHELLEASTDPQYGVDWGFVQATPAEWMILPGGELADMCENEADARQRFVGGYYAQKIWSNASAKAGHDPCAPAPARPYYAAAPVLAEVVTVASPAGSVTTKGVKLPVGTSKTIDLELFSDVPTADWKVDVQAVSPGATTPDVQTSLDVETGNDGTVLHLTLTRLRAAKTYGGTFFVVWSWKDGVRAFPWFAFASN